MRGIRLIAVVVALLATVAACGGKSDLASAPTSSTPEPTLTSALTPADSSAPADSAPSTEAAPVTTAAPVITAPPAPVTTVAAVEAASTLMTKRDRITGDITPKSVVASGAGLVFAQNMMYSHSVTAYQSDGTLAATISDGVDLASLGIPGYPGVSQGAPVEAAFTTDGRYAYVSNYSMYGAGFGPEGNDECSPSDGIDNSFLYRVDTQTLQIDQAIEVGAVPKYVAVTPDNRTVLVTNWCSFDMSVVDVASATETARVDIGRYPRGIAVSPDSSTAYVAVMGGDVVVAVDLATLAVAPLASTGDGPRHLVIAPDGSALFVTNNGEGTVSRVELATGDVSIEVDTGSQPRSMAISSDGSALYVVNYESSRVTKLRAADLEQIDTEPTDYHPIGITYEPVTRSVWVACYGGSIIVFDDTATA